LAIGVVKRGIHTWIHSGQRDLKAREARAAFVYKLFSLCFVCVMFTEKRPLRGQQGLAPQPQAGILGPS